MAFLAILQPSKINKLRITNPTLLFESLSLRQTILLSPKFPLSMSWK